MTSKIKVIALDFEGTLIATAGTPVPRPGLYKFLEFCKINFERVVIFTAVNENIFRKIANKLSENQSTPIWFKDIEYINWVRPKKNLNFISGVKPDDVILIDDFEFFIAEDQKQQWIQIETFDYPFPKDDRELQRIEKLLSTK